MHNFRVDSLDDLFKYRISILTDSASSNASKYLNYWSEKSMSLNIHLMRYDLSIYF
jgi:hypothetical protein